MNRFRNPSILPRYLPLLLVLLSITIITSLAIQTELTLRGRWPAEARTLWGRVVISDGFAYGVSLPSSNPVNGLTIVDIRDPLHPEQVGVYREALQYSGGVAVKGNFAYLTAAGDDQGVVIIDIQDRANPRRLGSHFFAKTDAVIVGNYLYATGNGLDVLDITDPTNARPVANYSGYSGRVTVSGEYLFLVSYAVPGMEIFNISDPSAPRRMGTFTSALSNIKDVEVAEGYAFLLGLYGMDVIDITNPSNPQRVGGYNLQESNGQGQGLAIHDRNLYIANGVPGVLRFDITSPAQPILKETIDTSGNAFDVALSPGWAYIADWEGGLKVFNITNPAEPVPVSGYNTTCGVATGVFVSRYAYLADTVGGFHIIDIADNENPKRLGTINTSDATSVTVQSDHAYITTSFGFQVISRTNSTSPELVASVDLGGWMWKISVDYRRAYVVGEGGVYIFDITNPASPQPLGAFTEPAGSHFMDVAANGNFLYAASSTSLFVLDIFDPTKPNKIIEYKATRPTSAQLRAFEIVGTKLFLWVHNFGLQILDLSIPSRPALLGEFESPNLYVREIAISGPFAYLACPNEGIRVLDISNLFRPFMIGGSSRFFCNDVTVRGNKVYAAAGKEGLFIFDAFESPVEPLLSFGLSNYEEHGFRLRIKGITGIPLEIERSTDLIDWEPWLNPILPNNELELLDLSATSKRQQFYRARAK